MLVRGDLMRLSREAGILQGESRPGLVFGNFASGTVERIGASLAQEFIIRKFTRRAGHMK